MLAELRKHGRVDRWPTQARRADGQAVPVEITLVRLLDSDSRPLGSVALIRDARQPQELVDQLQQQELELIRLNRNLELACLDQACQGPRPFLVALADVDGFKSINDHWGHQVGDAYLIELARAWLAYLQGSEILARLGGDEFAYLCYRPLSILRLIRRQVEPDLAAAFPEIPGGLSLGYAQFHPWSPAAATLLAQADRRLYRNKQRRRRTARR
jgi:diguanylate cyclase (GGDEF)-like protein